MKIKIIRDDNGAIIGFDLDSDCCTEDDFFIRNLPGNLMKGKASIETRRAILIIANAEEGTQSFEIPNEIEAIKAYLDSRHTEPSIKLGGFGLRSAYIRFKNEKVRLASITKTDELDRPELKQF